MSLPIVLHVCQLMLCMDCESEIKIYYYIYYYEYGRTRTINKWTGKTVNYIHDATTWYCSIFDRSLMPVTNVNNRGTKLAISHFIKYVKNKTYDWKRPITLQVWQTQNNTIIDWCFINIPSGQPWPSHERRLPQLCLQFFFFFLPETYNTEMWQNKQVCDHMHLYIG